MLPAWVFRIKPSFYRGIEKLARETGIAETELLDRALKLVKRESSLGADATPSKSRELVDVAHVGRVSVQIAKEMHRSISKHFGGLTNMSAQDRKNRAKKAAAKRWGKDE